MNQAPLSGSSQIERQKDRLDDSVAAAHPMKRLNV